MFSSSVKVPNIPTARPVAEKTSCKLIAFHTSRATNDICHLRGSVSWVVKIFFYLQIAIRKLIQYVFPIGYCADV